MNPLALGALKNYFADLTHAQPLVPETLVMLARQAGLRARRRALPQRAAGGGAAAAGRAAAATPAFDDARVALAANVARLNDVVFGPQDYALVARQMRIAVCLSAGALRPRRHGGARGRARSARCASAATRPSSSASRSSGIRARAC